MPNNSTTRRYPRRMGEAFSSDADNAQWLYPPERKPRRSSLVLGVLGIALWIGIGFLMLAK